jgi:hypothetical protein
MPDLESVIAGSIESAAGGDGGEGVVAEGTGAESVGAEGATAEGVVEQPVAVEGQPAAESVVAGEPAKRRGPIPFSRHEEILANARKERQAEFEALNQKIQALSWAEGQDVKDKLAALDIADRDPELFFNVLTQDPRYKALLEKRFGGGGAAPESAAAAPAAKGTASSQRPKPDVLNPDGSMGYSEEGLSKLLEWQQAQTTEAVTKKFEERFGPVEQAFQASTEWNKSIHQAKVVLDEARQTWPRFSEFESEIRGKIAEATAAGKILPLEVAYRQVVIPKFQVDRDAMRSEILAEINARPAAGIKPQGSGVRPTPAANQGPRDLEDVIMGAISGR